MVAGMPLVLQSAYNESQHSEEIKRSTREGCRRIGLEESLWSRSLIRFRRLLAATTAAGRIWIRSTVWQVPPPPRVDPCEKSFWSMPTTIPGTLGIALVLRCLEDPCPPAPGGFPSRTR